MSLIPGPRPEAGKAESAQNADRHVTLSRSVLLRCESSDWFRAFTDNFHHEYRARTATEITLVNMMASAPWRLMRLSHVEAANVDQEYAKQIEPAIVPEDFDTPDRAALASRDLVRNSRVLDALGEPKGGSRGSSGPPSGSSGR